MEREIIKLGTHPAGTAGSLVLNRGVSRRSSPVHCRGQHTFREPGLVHSDAGALLLHAL